MDTETSFAMIGDGTVKTTTPGTAVQLSATSIGCRRVEVSAFPENVGAVQVGGSTVLAAANGKRGRTLAPGESYTFHVKDVSMLYMDSLNANDGLSYVYFKGTA